MSNSRFGTLGIAWVTIATLASVALVLVATQHGLGVSPDSVAYVRAAQSWSSSGELQLFDGTPLTVFPPGLPITLGFLAILGIGANTAALGLNCLALIANGVVIHRLASIVLSSRRSALFALTWVMFSLSTISVHAMLWTEPVFNLLVNVSLLALTHIVLERRVRVWTFCLVVAVSVACVWRYAGVALLPTVGVTIWYADALHDRQRRTAWRVACTTGLCALGLLSIIVNNMRSGSGPLGPRGQSLNDPFDVLGQIPVGVGSIVLNNASAPSTTLAVVGLATLAPVLGIAFQWLQRRALATHPAAIPLLVWLAIYTAFLTSSELLTTIDPIDHRLLSPLVPVAIVILILMVRDTSLAATRRPLVTAVAYVHLIVIGLTSSLWAVSTNRSGLGMNGVDLANANWVTAVASLPADSGVISNDPYAVAWLTRRTPVKPGPDTLFYTHVPQDKRMADLGHFMEYGARRTFLVWFGNDQQLVREIMRSSGYLCSPVDSGDDWTIYAVNGQPNEAVTSLSAIDQPEAVAGR